jgi:putative aldouronate transport system substrate-binding protein
MLILAFSAFLAACSNSGNNGTKPNSKSSDKDFALPVQPGSITLRVAVPDNYIETHSYTQNLPVWQEVEKNTGVKIQWEVTGRDNYDEVMNVKLAAAADLPDIFKLPENLSPVKAQNDGLLLPLNDLINNYAPNLKKYFDERPEIYNRIKSPDGENYVIPNVVSAFSFTDPYVLFVRQDWLDELKLDKPTNLDEWYKMLKAFQDNDMNSNGEKDEVFLPNFKLEGLLYLAGSAYDMHQFFSEYGFYPDENGNVVYEYIDPRMEDMLKWLNKLYSEGLINPTFLTDGSQAIREKVSNNIAGASVRSMANTLVYAQLARDGGDPDAFYVPVLPPAENGYKGTYYQYGPIDGYHGIAADTKHPEAAIQWIDYIYASEEGNRLMNFGIEGSTYEMVDGKPQLNDFVLKNPDGDPPYTVLRKLGAFPNTPLLQDSEGFSSLLPQQVLASGPKELVEASEMLRDFLVPNTVFTLPTAEESEIISNIMPDVTTYVEETLANWITGQEPIDFQKYVSTVKSMGIDEVIRVHQAMHDRYVGK